MAYTMNNVVGTPLMWVGAVPLNAPLCSAGQPGPVPMTMTETIVTTLG